MQWELVNRQEIVVYMKDAKGYAQICMKDVDDDYSEGVFAFCILIVSRGT